MAPPSLPDARRPSAVQPSAGDAIAVPPGFRLRPSALGQRLPEAVQRKMEAFFGARFDDVRVHVGGEATSIGALAFTIGSDLYFAPGQYNPQTPQGQQLLGHELTHVVQQRAGRVRNPMGSSLAVVQDPALEAEAERMGMRAATAPAPIQAKPAGPVPIAAIASPSVPGRPAAAPGPIAPSLVALPTARRGPGAPGPAPAAILPRAADLRRPGAVLQPSPAPLRPTPWPPGGRIAPPRPPSVQGVRHLLHPAAIHCLQMCRQAHRLVDGTWAAGSSRGPSASLARVVQPRDTKFTPFKPLGVPQNVSVITKTLDKLIEYGLQYPKGGTSGNKVFLEKMVSDTGGDSAPGYPADGAFIFERYKDLLRAYNQSNAATAMHAINHNFADPKDTNLRAENIFLGSARSNTDLHFHKVENPIRQAMQKINSGNAMTYELSLKLTRPKTLTNFPDIVAWSDAYVSIPGVEKLAKPMSLADSHPLTAPATYIVKKSDMAANPLSPKWPRIIEYEVEPKYTYQPYPNLPQFLMDNIADAEQAVTDAEMGNPVPRDPVLQSQIDETVKAINIMKTHAHELFPQDFTCTATYWFASYDPDNPWYIRTETDIYSAEK